MNYYVLYFLPQGTECRIKSFEGCNSEEMTRREIVNFITEKRDGGCCNFRVKCSPTPLYGQYEQRNIMPHLNVLTCNDFDNLEGIDVTDTYIDVC